MEFFGFKVFFILSAGDEGDACVGFGECEVGKDVLFLAFGEVPEDNDAVGEDEHLGKGEGVRAYSGWAH